MSLVRQLTKVANKILNPNRLTIPKKNKPFTVLVEGNIASGKTTFLEHFKKFENVNIVPEPVESWRNCRGHNLLNLMYQDVHKWAFPFQSYVTLTTMKMLTQQTDKPIKLIERSVYSARFCFVEKMMNDGIITPEQHAVLDEWFQWVNDNVDLNIDLIVYLRCDPKLAFRRMQQRNRSEERSVSLEYLEDLHKYHENWLYYQKSFPVPAPVITLNADLDLSLIEDEYEKLEPCILKRALVPG